MATKPASAVKEFAADSLEKIAYGSVSLVPTQEPNDRNRLGYHVWRWLTTKQGTLTQVIAESGARITITQQEAAKIICDALAKQGVAVQ